MVEVFDIFSTKIIAYILLSLSFFYLLIGFNQDLDIYDEGVGVYGAARILNGHIPYRDFWTLYAPAEFYVLAGLFRLFGVSIIVVRIWSTFIMFVLSILVFLIASRMVSQKYALIAWFIILTQLSLFRYFASPIPPALLFSMLSSLFLLNFLCHHKCRKWLLLCGLSTGIASLFRQDMGFYAFLSEAIVIMVYASLKLAPREVNPLKRFLRVIGIESLHILGIAVVVLPVLVYFVSVIPIEELLYDLVIFPAKVFPKVRSLPYPLLNPVFVLTGSLSLTSYTRWLFRDGPFIFPPLIYSLAIVFLTVWYRKSRVGKDREIVWGTIYFVLMGILFFNHARVRSEHSHLLPTFIPATILFVLLLASIPKNKTLRFVIWVLSGLVVLSIVIKPFRMNRKIIRDGYISSSRTSFSIERASGIYWDKSEHYEKLIGHIQTTVNENERIFVGNTRHDQVYINDVMLYFLSNRHCATKYHELHPGLATTVKIQREIVRDLEEQKVRYLVLRDEIRQEPNESGISSGVFILDNYIGENFSHVEQFDAYAVWMRKPH